MDVLIGPVAAVPEVSFLLCNQASQIGMLRATNMQVELFDEKMATHLDKAPGENVIGFTNCAVEGGPCVYSPGSWAPTDAQVSVGDQQTLRTDSKMTCAARQGEIQIFLTVADLLRATERIENNLSGELDLGDPEILTILAFFGIHPGSEAMDALQSDGGGVDYQDLADYELVRRQRIHRAETRLLALSERGREKLINPATGQAYTDREIQQVLRREEVRKAEDLLMALADYPFSEGMDRPLNPRTGLPFTSSEAEKAVANARRRMAEDSLLTLSPSERLETTNPVTGNPYTQDEVDQAMENAYVRAEYPPPDTMFWPVTALANRITDPSLRHPIGGDLRPHNGRDFGNATSGTPIFSAGPGVVIVNEDIGACGGDIWILHDNGYKTRYLHVNANPGELPVGTRVTAGQFVTDVMSTEPKHRSCSTGDHLHFEIHDAGGVNFSWDDNVPRGTQVDAGAPIPNDFT